MLSKVFLQKMKELLLSQRQEITKHTTKENDVDMDGDETDEVQGTMLVELSNQLNSRNNQKLVQIDDALQRMSDKTYGLCQDCDEPIPEKRLLANPYFQTCVTCAEEREAEEKQRKRF